MRCVLVTIVIISMVAPMLQALKKYQTYPNITQHSPASHVPTRMKLHCHHASSCIIGCVSFFSFFFFLAGSSGTGLSSGSGISCAGRGAGLGEGPKSTRGSSCHLQGKKQKGDAKNVPEPKAGVSLTRPTLSKSHVLSCCNDCGKRLACVLCHIGHISPACVV